MKTFITALTYDYLQRTRSYAFLITLCASLAIAYTFVPEPNANYSTIRIADYVGYYNSAWFGYVTAIMSSVFLSLVGFYLVNSGIKTDGDTKIGQIIATTSVSNIKYLTYKTLSNFLVLLTLMGVIFVMSIVLFFLYNDGFRFEPFQFIIPYLAITVPALFFVSALAVAFEVVFGKYSVIQNVGFFFLFSALVAGVMHSDSHFAWDVFGNKIVTYQMEETVQNLLQAKERTSLNIGYVIGNLKPTNKFEFSGVNFPLSFVISRFLWILASMALIALISPIFHRFNRRGRIFAKKQLKDVPDSDIHNEISLSTLAPPKTNNGILPLIKTELTLMIRKGKKWLWLVNLVGMVLLAALPLSIAHQMVLPVLWFLQVGRISEITTREFQHNVHYFAFSSYRPLGRLLLSQLLSGFILLGGLSLPLLIRLLISGNFEAFGAVVLGVLFIVLLAAVLGILSKGKKIFEVLFFMITYANINGIPFADYFGGFEQQQGYLLKLGIGILVLASITFIVRQKQLRQ